MALCENHIATLLERHEIGAGTRETIVTATACPALKPWGIWIAGTTTARDDFAFVRHHPSVWQALACLEGFGEVWIDNGWQTCGPGQAYLTPPHTPHAYHARAGTGWHICWVISYTLMAPVPATAPRLVTASGASLACAIQGLAAETASGNTAFTAQWARLVHDCARRLWTPTIASADQTGDPRLRLVWDMVERNLTHPWTIGALADRAGVSVEHLRRLSLRHMGVSPLRQVTRLRMRYASALLETGNYTVTAVAAQVGYENPFAFSVAFKREWGISPSEWHTLSTRGKQSQ